MADPATPTPEVVRLAARAAALDAAAAEIVTELRERGVRPILLKGPSIARWLYAPSELRAYGDIDLLIAPADFEVAEETFRELGFLHFPVAGVEHGDAWVHQSKQVDFELHRRLVGMNAAPGEVWSCLASHTTSLEIFGVSLEILDVPARTMQVALHAAQHGTEVRKPREDLVRALEQVSYEDWTTALSLARELDATEAFAAGLRLLPEGERLAERLALPQTASAKVVLMAGDPPPAAVGLARVASARGPAAKLRMLWAKIFPRAAYMRLTSRLARRSRLGLVLSYVVRLAWLVARAPAAVRAWLAARSQAGRSGS